MNQHDIKSFFYQEISSQLLAYQMLTPIKFSLNDGEVQSRLQELNNKDLNFIDKFGSAIADYKDYFLKFMNWVNGTNKLLDYKLTASLHLTMSMERYLDILKD